MSLDRFVEKEPQRFAGLTEDRWQSLNLTQLDLTMGQKWMQKDIHRAYGVNGGYTNLAWTRTAKWRGKDLKGKPHVRGDFTRSPFRSASFRLILFDPPHLSGPSKLLLSRMNDAKSFVDAAHTWRVFGWFDNIGHMRKQLYLAFREIERLLMTGGVVIFKWSPRMKPLKWTLRLVPRGLRVEKIIERKSRGATKKWPTYHVWIKRVGGGE